MILHLYIGKRHRAVLAWKNALPPNSFSFYFRAILMAEQSGRFAVLPSVSFSERALTGRESYTVCITIKEEELIRFVREIPIGDRSGTLLDIVAAHLKNNYSMSDATLREPVVLAVESGKNSIVRKIKKNIITVAPRNNQADIEPSEAAESEEEQNAKIALLMMAGE